MPLHERIVHVAANDDTAGFDVACPSTSQFLKSVRVEVKATVRPQGVVSFFVTRNEAHVGGRDPAWRLMVMRRSGDLWRPAGHVPFTRVSSHLPEDQGAGRWESCHVLMSDDELIPGLP
jgi:hypothetical protein